MLSLKLLQWPSEVLQCNTGKWLIKVNQYWDSISNSDLVPFSVLVKLDSLQAALPACTIFQLWSQREGNRLPIGVWTGLVWMKTVCFTFGVFIPPPFSGVDWVVQFLLILLIQGDLWRHWVPYPAYSSEAIFVSVGLLSLGSDTHPSISCNTIYDSIAHSIIVCRAKNIKAILTVFFCLPTHQFITLHPSLQSDHVTAVVTIAPRLDSAFAQPKH